MSEVEVRMKSRGIVLPGVSRPRANYVPVTEANNILYVSGQVPRMEGVDLYVGRVGEVICADEAKDAARVCALNIIAQLRAYLGGDLDRVKSCVRVRGYVNAVPDFTSHAAVINGASDLIVEVFGDRGRHSRTAIGVGSLPHGFAVEVEAEFELADE